jgi:hypothetical protein
MKIRHSKPVFTTLIAAIALGSASIAGAAEAGLSHAEQAAQHAIVDASSTSIGSSVRDYGVATLVQNESAAQHAIVVDHGAVPRAVTAGGEAVALIANEQAAQRAIVDAPRANRAIAIAAATAAR